MLLWFVVNLALLVLLVPQNIHSLKKVIKYRILLHYVTVSFIAEQNIPIQLDEVQCTGGEGNLGQCEFVTDHNCDHSENAGVVCIGKIIYFATILAM